MSFSLLSLSSLYQPTPTVLNPNPRPGLSQPTMKAAHNLKYCFVDLCKCDTIMPQRGSVYVLVLVWEIARDQYNPCVPHHVLPKNLIPFLVPLFISVIF